LHSLTCDPRLLHVHQVRLEHALWCFVSLRSDFDDSTVRELSISVDPYLCTRDTHSVVLDQSGGLFRKFLVHVQIITHETQSLLDTSHSLEIGCPLESVSSHQEKLDQVPRDISTSDIQSSSEVRQGESIIDGNDMGYTISRVDDNTGL
jgi:hypothetical protein